MLKSFQLCYRSPSIHCLVQLGCMLCNRFLKSLLSLNLVLQRLRYCYSKEKNYRIPIMFKHFLLLLVAAFLFSACAERGIAPELPIRTIEHTTPHTTKENVPATKSVTPAQTPVKAVTEADEEIQSVTDATQNSVAGILVFAIALALLF